MGTDRIVHRESRVSHGSARVYAGHVYDVGGRVVKGDPTRGAGGPTVVSPIGLPDRLLEHFWDSRVTAHEGKTGGACYCNAGLDVGAALGAASQGRAKRVVGGAFDVSACVRRGRSLMLRSVGTIVVDGDDRSGLTAPVTVKAAGDVVVSLAADIVTPYAIGDRGTLKPEVDGVVPKYSRIVPAADATTVGRMAVGFVVSDFPFEQRAEAGVR